MILPVFINITPNPHTVFGLCTKPQEYSTQQSFSQPLSRPRLIHFQPSFWMFFLWCLWCGGPESPQLPCVWLSGSLDPDSHSPGIILPPSWSKWHSAGVKYTYMFQSLFSIYGKTCQVCIETEPKVCGGFLAWAGSSKLPSLCVYTVFQDCTALIELGTFIAIDLLSDRWQNGWVDGDTSNSFIYACTQNNIEFRQKMSLEARATLHPVDYSLTQNETELYRWYISTWHFFHVLFLALQT